MTTIVVDKSKVIFIVDEPISVFTILFLPSTCPLALYLTTKAWVTAWLLMQPSSRLSGVLLPSALEVELLKASFFFFLLLSILKNKYQSLNWYNPRKKIKKCDWPKKYSSCWFFFLFFFYKLVLAMSQNQVENVQIQTLMMLISICVRAVPTITMKHTLCAISLGIITLV